MTIASVVTPPTPTPVATTVTGSAAAFAYGTAGSLAITVSPATASGTVTVTEGGTALGTATITNGAGTLALAAKALKPGTHLLVLGYSGNATHLGSTNTIAVEVTKANPKVKLNVDKTITKGKGTKAVVKVTAPDGIEVTGKVKLVIKGTDKKFTAKVVNGKAVFDLPKFKKAGTFTLRAVYQGSDLLTKETKKVDGHGQQVVPSTTPRSGPAHAGPDLGHFRLDVTELLSLRHHRTQCACGSARARQEVVRTGRNRQDRPEGRHCATTPSSFAGARGLAGTGGGIPRRRGRHRGTGPGADPT